MDEEKLCEVIDKFYQAGLFDLDELYTNEHVDDGGEWELTITYSDGVTKVSKGINAEPDGVFDDANLEFFYITGEELFGYVADIYKNPPSMRIAYSGDGRSLETQISSHKYTWNDRETIEKDLIQAALERSYTDIDVNYSTVTMSVLDESLYSGMPKSTYKYTKATVVSYDLSGGDQKEILVSRWNRDIEFDIEPNRIYEITVEFKGGVGEYAFCTKVSSDQTD